jgi:transcriptional regulator with GAF, ATPase, and Fis domain
VPRELVESTLFGHRRGAFTGATADQTGLFDQADGGTIFLDEIGELEIGLQPALLRALDRGAIRPVGAATYHQVEARVIAATHRDLGERIAAAEFREDLYYRLAVVRLTVPPLRDRPEDIPLLVESFLAAAGRGDLEIDDATLQALAAHRWPGNVRELHNAVDRGVALSRDGRLAIALSTGPGSPAPALASTSAPAPRRPFRDAKAAAVADFERDYLESLMVEHRTLTEAAHAAGMDRKHLRTLLKRHKIG